MFFFLKKLFQILRMKNLREDFVNENISPMRFWNFSPQYQKLYSLRKADFLLAQHFFIFSLSFFFSRTCVCVCLSFPPVHRAALSLRWLLRARLLRYSTALRSM